MEVVSKPDINDIEIPLLLEAIFQRYGYDFRSYSKAHVKRRILQRLRLSGLESVSMLQHRVLADPSFASEVLKDLSINVTEMFRDPKFYAAVREKVVPLLKTWSYCKIWHAGCSTGEEVYSMAILLSEEGVYDRTQLYATDFNYDVVKQAREGIYPIQQMKRHAMNYVSSGARASFTDHFYAKYDSAIMNNNLKKNIVWAHHNLVTDGDFTETNMIVCRNVLIYFNKDLQNKVIRLFHQSLVRGGILCLGHKETLMFSEYGKYFEALDEGQRIYKKRYATE
ncbi:MAG: protein-glutamate O-methyltransferase CheR [Flavobacteriales bacterium]|nr:protein-glutamate O-methyltransferase CheR [Flavobacteriales bacterium]